MRGKKEFYTSSRKKKKRAKFLILVGIITGLSFSIIQYTINLPYFYVRNIKIRGLRKLPSSKILKDIPPSTSIFKLNLREISEKIQSERMVRKVRIMRKLPSTLILEIEERSPYVCVKKEKGFWQVDKEGVVIDKVKDLNGFTLIEGIDPFKDKELLLKAIKVLELSRSVNLKVEKLTVEGRNRGITLGLKDGIRVILGEFPNYRYLSYLPYIFKDARERKEKISSVDLRFAGQIVTSLKQKR